MGIMRKEARRESGHRRAARANNEARPRIKTGVKETKKRLPNPTAPYHQEKLETK
jgi:hypothetical protein